MQQKAINIFDKIVDKNELVAKFYSIVVNNCKRKNNLV